MAPLQRLPKQQASWQQSLLVTSPGSDAFLVPVCFGSICWLFGFCRKCKASSQTEHERHNNLQPKATLPTVEAEKSEKDGGAACIILHPFATLGVNRILREVLTLQRWKSEHRLLAYKARLYSHRATGILL